MKNKMIIRNKQLAVGYLFQLTLVFKCVYSREHYGT